jgi:hypothetical protein
VKNDGFQPNTRYVWVDPAARVDITGIQVVGDFMTLLGGTSNWNNNDPNFVLFDDGANGDGAAGDGLYAAGASRFGSSPGITYRQVKGVIPGTWDFQFGGPGEGFTKFGDNTALRFSIPSGQDVIFKLDAVTGRIGVGNLTISRPATLNAGAPAGVGDWSIY